MKCWLGRIVLDTNLHYHCFEVRIDIKYYREFVLKDKDHPKLHENGTLTRVSNASPGIAVVFRGEKDSVRKFHSRAFIYAIVSAFVVFQIPTYWCKFLAEYFGPARHIYKTAFNRKFLLNHEIVSWMVRCETALSTFDKCVSSLQKGAVNPGLHAADMVRGLSEVLPEAEQLAAAQEIARFFEAHAKHYSAEQGLEVHEGSISREAFIRLFEESEVVTTANLVRWHQARGHKGNSMLEDMLHQFEDVKPTIPKLTGACSEPGTPRSSSASSLIDSVDQSSASGSAVSRSFARPRTSSRSTRDLARLP